MPYAYFMVQYDSKPAGWVNEFRFTRRDGASGPEFYCQVDCWCGSTLGSGEFYPSMRVARDMAAEGLADHNARNKHAAKLKL